MKTFTTLRNYFFIPAIFLLSFISLTLSCNRNTISASKVTNDDHLTQQDYRRSQNPLSDYVYTPDDAFEYKIVLQKIEVGYTNYVVRMVSQEWLTTEEVEDPIWWHWIEIVVPDVPTPEIGFLYVGGGSRGSDMPAKPDGKILEIANQTNSVVAQIHNIPNQPTVFKNDNFGPRGEDELIAFGWRQFLEAGGGEENAEWLARFPMTKAVVRAMDVISDLTHKEENINTVSKFVVAGASKRGWTTWTTGATDKRVVAIVPIVIDMLNMLPSFKHHWRAYGRWADAVHDYNVEGIMEWQDSKEYESLVKMTEPYSFLDELTIPKLILSASGDQFFLPDSWQFYWNDLKGEKHVRYIPNTDHGMRETDVMETLISFYQMILSDHLRPDFDWNVKEGVTTIQTDKKVAPLTIKLWEANNPDARNFQLKEIGEAYKSSNIPLADDGNYIISVEKPSKGYSAYFVELTYEGIADIPLKLTTGTVVTPDTYLFEPFVSKDPKGERE